jgi:2-methylisocitrate lyase-like PEP mutase family enzyme
MSDPRQRARIFRGLHVPGKPVILFNAWDAGSARAVAEAGARAIATGSWSVAAAHGYEDREKLPLALAIANLERIVAAVELPVTIDLEAGYGKEPESVADTMAKAVAAGAVGCNLEDQIIGGDALFSIPDQAARIRAARAAATNAGVPAFLNARTDVYLKAGPAGRDEAVLDDAVRRAQAYAEAGADGLFVPGLLEEAQIGRLCKASPLPVNIMILPGAPPPRRLAELGVARISHGPGPYRLAMKALEDAARSAFTETDS